jgi:hypothetical protein
MAGGSALSVLAGIERIACSRSARAVFPAPGRPAITATGTLMGNVRLRPVASDYGPGVLASNVSRRSRRRAPAMPAAAGGDRAWRTWPG